MPLHLRTDYFLHLSVKNPNVTRSYANSGALLAYEEFATNVRMGALLFGSARNRVQNATLSLDEVSVHTACIITVVGVVSTEAEAEGTTLSELTNKGCGLPVC